MIKCKIDVTKIDKSAIFVGEKGKYIDIALVEKPNEYGDDGFVTQSMPKDAEGKYPRGPILGNWRNWETKKTAPKPTVVKKEEDDSEIPF